MIKFNFHPSPKPLKREKLPHVKRLFDEISAHPAAIRAEALKTKHEYKTVVDDDARKVLFPQNARVRP